MGGARRARQSSWPVHDEVASLLGRRPAGPFSVVVRRPDGSPVVIENAPFLYDGRPMPTRFWLVDPRLRQAVSRLESSGGVRDATAAIDDEELASAHTRYAAARDALVPTDHSGARPSGGVGGTRRGVKCLHAHLAWFLAGGEDPVGGWVAERVGLELNEYRRASGPAAAIDCGTNSTRLLVVGADHEVLQREMRITRLGAGVDRTHRLADAAVSRTVAVLRDYRSLMDAHRVVAARMAATSATRDATNSEEFFREAEDATGIRPELLSGREEGALSFAGATARLPSRWRHLGPLLVVDVGGGSTELVVGDPAPEGADARLDTVSLDIGCVRVAERFFGHDPPLEEELGEGRRFVEEVLRGARDRLPPLAPGGLMIGLAGTVSTAAALEARLDRYDRAVLHHSVLRRAQVARWMKTLAGEGKAARLRRPGMVEGREDVIVGGMLVLDAVMEVFDRQECVVSEDDILDGLAESVLRSLEEPPEAQS